MSDDERRRKKSPEGRSRKSKGSDSSREAERTQRSPRTDAPTSAQGSQAERSPSTARASSRSPSGFDRSRSSSKSPMREVGTAVLDALRRTPSPRQLCCGTASEELETKSTKSSVRRRTPSPPDASSSPPYSPAPRAVPKKSCLRKGTLSPQPSSSGDSSQKPDMPLSKSLGVETLPEDEPSASRARSPPRVTFKDIKEGLMPPDDTLFRMFRFRGEVHERIPLSQVAEEPSMDPNLPPYSAPPAAQSLQGESTGTSIVAEVHYTPPTHPTGGAEHPVPSDTEQTEMSEESENANRSEERKE
nr:serine/arginine repetitive matrix protein 1-like [Dermacentor andersoni]